LKLMVEQAGKGKAGRFRFHNQSGRGGKTGKCYSYPLKERGGNKTAYIKNSKELRKEGKQW